MKIATLGLVGFVLALATFFYSRIVEPINMEPLQFVDSAILTERSIEVTEISLKPIRKSMASSEWTSKRFINKGSYQLKIDGFPDIYVSYYGGFFWADGQRGFWVVPESERSAFNAFFR